MTQYGLPGVRNAEGQLQAVDHTFDFDGDEIVIKLYPPTISEFERYEDMGSDVDIDELFDIVDKHLVKPEIEREGMTSRELMCYLQGIVDYGIGGGNQFMRQVQQELDEREATAGN